jgi:GTP-binding protein HflX
LLQQAPRIDRNEYGQPARVWLSAHTGEGLELLPQAIAELVGGEMAQLHIELGPDQGRLRAALYKQHGVVTESHAEDGGCQLHIRLPRTDWQRLLAAENIEEKSLLCSDSSAIVLDSSAA